MKAIVYTEKEDFTQNGQTYDVIFDMVQASRRLHSINPLLSQTGYIWPGQAG